MLRANRVRLWPARSYAPPGFWSAGGLSRTGPGLSGHGTGNGRFVIHFRENDVIFFLVLGQQRRHFAQLFGGLLQQLNLLGQLRVFCLLVPQYLVECPSYNPLSATLGSPAVTVDTNWSAEDYGSNFLAAFATSRQLLQSTDVDELNHGEQYAQ